MRNTQKRTGKLQIKNQTTYSTTIQVSPIVMTTTETCKHNLREVIKSCLWQDLNPDHTLEVESEGGQLAQSQMVT